MDSDLVHQPGHHPLLPLPKALHVRPRKANAQAAEVLKQMMDDSLVAKDPILEILADVEMLSKKESVAFPSPETTSSLPSESSPEVMDHDSPEPVAEKLSGRSLKTAVEDTLLTPALSAKDTLPPHAEDSRPENMCDLPMPKADTTYVPKVDLSPGLSSLSVQHPTRVWNCLLHSCAPDQQPLMKWEFATQTSPEGYSAQMTLILPPAHPILRKLSGGMALPWDPHSPEYLEVVRQLGGSRVWTGGAKQLKADAQNEVIRKCIADNGLLWVNYEIMRNVDPGAYLGVPQVDSGAKGSRLTDPLQPSAHKLKRPVESDHMCRMVKPKLTGTSTGATKLPRSSIKSNPRAGIKATGPLTSVSQATSRQGKSVTTLKNQHQQVDWQEQLSSFCLEAGLPTPKYYQKIERQAGAPTQFFGQVTVEHDRFESDKGFIKLKDARQEIARFVFSEHFGQEPALQ